MRAFDKPNSLLYQEFVNSNASLSYYCSAHTGRPERENTRIEPHRVPLLQLGLLLSAIRPAGGGSRVPGVSI